MPWADFCCWQIGVSLAIVRTPTRHGTLTGRDQFRFVPDLTISPSGCDDHSFTKIDNGFFCALTFSDDLGFARRYLLMSNFERTGSTVHLFFKDETCNDE